MRFFSFLSSLLLMHGMLSSCAGDIVIEGPSPSVASPSYESDGTPPVPFSGTSEECFAVSLQIKKNGGTTRSSVQAYCENECTFNSRLVRSCEIYNTRLLDAYLPSVTQVSEFITKLTRDPDDVEELDIYTDASRDKIVDTLMLALHAMLGIIPLIVVQQRWLPGWAAMAVSFVCVFFTYATSSSMSTVTVTAITAMVAHVLPPNSAVCEVALYNSLAILATVFASVTIKDNIVLSCVGLGTATVMAYNLGHGVTTKQRSAAATTFVTILQLLMFLDVIINVIDLRGEESPLLRYMMYAIRCAFPNGKSRMVIYNMLGNTARMTSGTLTRSTDVVTLFTGWLIVNLSLFFGSRAVIGMLIRINTRAKSGDGLVADDLLVYLADVAAPMRWLSSIAQGKAKASSPGFMYGALAFGLMLYEANSANDLLVIRIASYVISRTFRTHHYKVSTFLGAIDFSNMSYKTIGALPWLSTSKLRDIQKGVHTVTFRHAALAVRGVATAMGGGKFITVGHCVFRGDATTATLDVNGSPMTFAIDPKPLHAGDQGDDPVYGFTIPSTVDVDSIPDDVGIHPGTDFASVAIVNRDYVTMVPDSNMEWNDNQISIPSGLAKGDSGSPIIAIGETGELSVLGVVSSGSHDPAVPNRGSLAMRARSGPPTYMPANASVYFGGAISPKSVTATMTPEHVSPCASPTDDDSASHGSECDDDDATLDELSSLLTDMLSTARISLAHDPPEAELDADGDPGDGRAPGDAKRIKSARKNARAKKAREIMSQALLDRGVDVTDDAKHVLSHAVTMGTNARVRAFNTKRGFGKIGVDIITIT